MGFHTEEPFIAFLGLMHIWITLIVLFLVELGASIMVSSTNVPSVIITPLSDNNWLMGFNNWLVSFCLSNKCLKFMMVVQSGIA